MPNWWEIGRVPFPIVAGKDDYSGQDFEAVYVAGGRALSHAFLNGTSLSRSVFVDTELDQVEFGEAQIIEYKIHRLRLY